MTVSREDIDKAEGALRLAEATLAGDEAQIVAIRAQIAALDPSNTSERAELAVQIQSLQPSVERDRIAVDQAKATLARLRSEFSAQKVVAPTAPLTTIPRAAPTAASTGTVRGNSPAPTTPRPIAGSAQTPSPVPQGVVPPNSATGTAAAQPTQPATSNTSPQPETEGSDPLSSDEKTRYQLAQTWDEEEVIRQLLNGDYFRSNLMNQYDNCAYHWRLFAMPDLEYLYDGDGQMTSIEELFARIDSYKQVTIAETGVTGFNISDVSMESVYSQNAKVLQIDMKINEPNGVQFLDALKQACVDAGVINYMDFFYYLELTFKGYNKDGSINLSPFADLPNGGRWLWTVKINNIDVNLGTGGGTYKLSMLNKDAGAMESDYGIAIDTIQARGDTMKEFFDDLAVSLNEAWATRLARKGIITHEFVLHGIPGANQQRSYVQPDGERITTEEAARANAATQALNGGIPSPSIEAMKIYAERGDWNNIRSRGSDFAIVDPKNAENIEQDGSSKPASTKVTANIPRGTSISNIITEIFSVSEHAQSLAKDSCENVYSADMSKEFVNEKRFRECVTWKVIPEVRYVKRDNKPVYDFLSNRYARFVVWHIYPHIDQEPILSRTQINSAFDAVAGEKFQKGSVAALAVRGLLSKRYDYLFTGVNTEVLNLDLNFNMAWSVMLPRIQNNYSDQALAHGTFNKEKPQGVDALEYFDVADQAYDEENAAFQSARLRYNKMSREERLQNAELRKEIDERRSVVENLARQRNEAQGALTDARKEREAYMKEKFGDIVAPDQNYERGYVENTLDRSAEEQAGRISDALLIPFSYSGGDQAKQEAGLGSTGQYHRGRSLYGTILNQSADPAVQKFTTIEMTVRADPYWIGEGSYEIALAHAGDLRVPDFDDDRIGPNHVLVRFKYPTGTDEGGNITLKDNETVTGIYKITRIVNKFSNGQLTHEITGVRLALIDLYASLFGIPVGEETEERIDPVAAQRERAANEETLKRITEEQARVNPDLRRQREAAEDALNNANNTPPR